MQTDCPSLADQGGLTKVGGFAAGRLGWLAGGWAFGHEPGAAFCEKAEAVLRLGTVRWCCWRLWWCWIWGIAEAARVNCR